MCTLELWKGLVFAHTRLMTEHMDNESHCAASYSKGNWDLRWKGKVFKKEFKKDCPPREVCVGAWMQSLALRGRVLPCSLACHAVVRSSHSPQSVGDLYLFLFCQLHIFGEDTCK